MTSLTEYGEVVLDGVDEWGSCRIDGVLEDGRTIIVIESVLTISLTEIQTLAGLTFKISSILKSEESSLTSVLALTVSKKLHQILQLIETLKKNIFCCGFIEAQSFQDLIRKSGSLVRKDELGFVGTFIFSSSLQKEETLCLSKTLSFSHSQIFQEILSLAEVLRMAQSFYQTLIETLGLAKTYSFKSIHKVEEALSGFFSLMLCLPVTLSESVALESFLFFRFLKTSTECFQLLDKFSASFFRKFTEVLSWQEEFEVLKYLKVLVQTLKLETVYFGLLRRQLSETLQFVDVLSFLKAAWRFFEESLTFVVFVQFKLKKLRVESLSLTEALTKRAAFLLSDTLTLSEILLTSIIFCIIYESKAFLTFGLNYVKIPYKKLKAYISQKKEGARIKRKK